MTTRTAEQRFGQRLQELRRERGWNQERVAQEMTARGFTWNQQVATRTETARRAIRVNEVDALAQILGVPLAVLLDPGADADTTTRLAGVDRAMAELEDVQRRLDEQLRRLRHERIDLDVEQGSARWRAQQQEV